jgi:hypothetical protein
MVIDVEAFGYFRGNVVRVEAHDILEAMLFGEPGAKSQCRSNLPFIDTIKKMAVMNQKTPGSVPVRCLTV